MLNTININLKTDIKTDRPTTLPIKLMSQDKNNNQFILRFTSDGESVALDGTYTVEILTKFTNSGTSSLTSAVVRQDCATWEFDTDYITQDETVYNYVYVRKAGSLVVSADANAFYFQVGLSEIDKDAGRVAEVYDENYQKYLDEFKENVDFEEIAQAEQARKEAEILRQESYDAKVDTAIVEADVVEKVDNKVTELTPQINSLTAQLEQGAKRDLSLSTVKRDIPLVSFVDDDGNRAVLTKLRPLSEEYGVPFTICMPSDFIMSDSGLSLAQLKDLQDSNGFEIASHGKTHTPINTSMSNEQQEVEVYESWRQMREWGLNVETIVYPYGQSTPYAREIVSRYYKAGVSTDARLNPTPLLTYRLGRLQFPTTGWTLNDYKAKVDEAVENKSWLIFMLHCGQAEHDAATQTILEQLIQYVQSLNVDIVNITDGIDISGNIIDINEQSIYYAKNGENNIRDYYFEPIDRSNNNASHNGSHLPTDFPDHKATINILTTAADTATMPNGQRGALLTQKGNQASAVTSQLYLTTRGLFYRSGSGTDWHSEFNRVYAGMERTFTLDFGTINPGEAVTKDTQIQNMFAGHFIALSNKTVLHRSLMMTYHISANWTLVINILNPSATAREVGMVEFNALWMRPAN